MTQRNEDPTTLNGAGPDYGDDPLGLGPDFGRPSSNGSAEAGEDADVSGEESPVPGEASANGVSGTGYGDDPLGLGPDFGKPRLVGSASVTASEDTGFGEDPLGLGFGNAGSSGTDWLVYTPGDQGASDEELPDEGGEVTRREAVHREPSEAGAELEEETGLGLDELLARAAAVVRGDQPGVDELFARAAAAVKDPSGSDEQLDDLSGSDDQLERSSGSDERLDDASGSDERLNGLSGSDERRDDPSGSDERLDDPSGSGEGLERPSGSSEGLERPSGSDERPDDPSGSDERPDDSSGSDAPVSDDVAGQGEEVLPEPVMSVLDGLDDESTGGLAGRLKLLQRLVDLGTGRVDEELLEDASALLARSGDRMRLSGEHTVVTLAGGTGSGKSSLFNAVCGLELSPTGMRRPMTSAAHACVWGLDGAGPLLDWLAVDKRFRYARASALDRAGSRAENSLRGLVLLDLPDHDSIQALHRAEVDRFVAVADLLIWVVDPQKYADAALHRDYIVPFARHASVTLIVLNQTDRLEPAEVKDCVSDLRRLLEAEGLTAPVILTTSAVAEGGVDGLREVLSDTVAAGNARADRLSADVDKLIERFADLAGEGILAPAPLRGSAPLPSEEPYPAPTGSSRPPAPSTSDRAVAGTPKTSETRTKPEAPDDAAPADSTASDQTTDQDSPTDQTTEPADTATQPAAETEDADSGEPKAAGKSGSNPLNADTRRPATGRGAHAVRSGSKRGAAKGSDSEGAAGAGRSIGRRGAAAGGSDSEGVAGAGRTGGKRGAATGGSDSEGVAGAGRTGGKHGAATGGSDSKGVAGAERSGGGAEAAGSRSERGESAGRPDNGGAAGVGRSDGELEDVGPLDGAGRVVDARRVEELVDALTVAAGVPAVAEAMESAYELRASDYVGWPLARWVRRFRRDPLRMMRLTELREELRGSFTGPVGAQQGDVDNALHGVTDGVTVDVPGPWRRSIRDAARAHAAELPDALGAALRETLPSFNQVPRWWWLVKVWQYLLIVGAVLGLAWVGLLLAYGVLDLGEAPSKLVGDTGILPWVLILLACMIGMGALTAAACRNVVALSAARHGQRIELKMRESIEAVAEEKVLKPIADELAVFAEYRGAVESARR